VLQLGLCLDHAETLAGPDRSLKSAHSRTTARSRPPSQYIAARSRIRLMDGCEVDFRGVDV
jgi:hypothetical protein